MVYVFAVGGQWNIEIGCRLFLTALALPLAEMVFELFAHLGVLSLKWIIAFFHMWSGTTFETIKLRSAQKFTTEVNISCAL